MKKIERYNLIENIALTLQADMTTSGINIFLGGFNVEHKMVNIVPSKRVYVGELLANESDNIILQIARELDIKIPKISSTKVEELTAYLEKGGFESAKHDFERALEYLQTDIEQALGSA